MLVTSFKTSAMYSGKLYLKLFVPQRVVFANGRNGFLKVVLRRPTVEAGTEGLI